MHRLLSATLAVAFLAGAAPAADAQTARQARQEVEASMLVTGEVDISRSGQITAHRLDQPDKLPGLVVNLIEQAMPALRFEPVLVDGVPADARARMSLRLIATPVGDGNMNVRIASAHFGDQPETGLGEGAESVRIVDMKPPRYPANVARAGGKGTVYLLVKVDRNGSVGDVAAEQTNLTVLGNARVMQSIRNSLAKAATDSARTWTFAPPTEGAAAVRDHWVVRVPVSFHLGSVEEAGYGEWSGYHPGEQTRPAWAAPTQPGFSPDSLAAGGITPETSRFKLLTPFEG